jgi:formylglycine-generating enzyme required for sulfatase activity
MPPCAGIFPQKERGRREDRHRLFISQREAPIDPGDLGSQESYDVRGGGWSNEPADVPCGARNVDPPKFGHSNLGFRVALHHR